jgi:hypothetical protein
MAVKSVIDVEINDASFKKYVSAFKKYEEESKAFFKGVPAEQREELEARTKGWEQRRKAIALETREVAKAATGHRRITADSVSQEHAWRGIARNAKGFAGHITDATRSILRWTSVTGLFSGLLGAGGLFGIERLAQSAGGARRSSLGLGVGAGAQNAFAVNYGRLVDPEGFLGGVNEAMNDVTKRTGLYGAGLTERDLRGKDTTQVADALLPALKRIADQTPEAMMAQVLQARHLDQFVSLQEFERLKNTPAGELGSYHRGYLNDIRALDLSKDQLKAWQDLQVQLHRAGESIEATFIRGLTPLAPQIAHLSDSFTKLIDTLLSNPKVKEWLDSVAVGLGHLADYVGTPAFAANVGEFVTKVGDLAKAIGRAYDWIVSWFPFTAASAGGKPPASEHAPGEPGWGFTPGLGWHNTPLTPPGGSPQTTPAPGFDQGGVTMPDGSSFIPQSFRQLENKEGLPAGLLDAAWSAESGRGRYMHSSAGAMGHFQFMKATADQYHVTNPYDLGQSSRGAAAYFHDLMKEFSGDVAKAVAAYNWGPGNLEKDIRRHGENWRSFLPDETRKYVGKILGSIGQRGQGVHVKIDNNTGGNAAVSASQLSV